MLSIGPTQDTIGLTIDGALNIPASSLRGVYPDGSEAQLVFTDGAGITLLILDGDFSSRKGIAFQADPATVAGITAGTNFVLYLTLPGMDQVALRYGTVLRLQPSYPLALPTDTSSARQFTADFSGGFLGPQWVSMGGLSGLSIHDNSLFSLPPTMGPNFAFFSKVATRWYMPLNGDSVSVEVAVLRLGQGAFGFGTFNIIVCADSQFNNYMGVQIYVDVVPSNSHVQAITGTGPTTWDLQGTPISNQVANGDTYSVKYDALSGVLSLYKGTNLSPLLTWVDIGGVVPIGPGFRYTGLSWQNSLFQAVCEPTAWQAHDGV